MVRVLCWLLGTIFCLGGALWAPVGLSAAEYTITPALRLQETYDDNLFLENVDDFEHRIAGTLELRARSERAELTTRGSWDVSEYQRHHERDTVDQLYQVAAQVAQSTALQFHISGAYAHDYTFTSTLEETGIVAERSKRSSATVEPGMTWAWGLRDQVAVSYNFGQTEYDLVSYPDSEIHGLSLLWSHSLMNERTDVLVQLGANRADYEAEGEDTEQRTYSISAGLGHRFTETLQVRLTTGVRYSESRFPSTELIMVTPALEMPTVKSVEEEKTGWIADGMFRWDLERVSLSATVNRDVLGSIYGENITRDRVNCSLQYQWTDRLDWGGSAGYNRSETDGYVTDAKQQTFSVGTNLGYRLTERTGLRLGYSYLWTEDQISNDSDERNRVFLELTTAWPWTLE